MAKLNWKRVQDKNLIQRRRCDHVDCGIECDALYFDRNHRPHKKNDYSHSLQNSGAASRNSPNIQTKLVRKENVYSIVMSYLRGEKLTGRYSKVDTSNGGLVFTSKKGEKLRITKKELDDIIKISRDRS